jgi:hypothetical protein
MSGLDKVVVGEHPTFAEVVAAALDAGIGFTIQGPTRDSPHEVLTLTTFEDDGDEHLLICEGVATADEALDRIVWVAAQHKAGWD